jgi:hypothetical protein
VLVSFLLLILLVATTPVSLFLEGPLERAAAALAAAVAVAAVGVFVRAGEGGHLAKLLRPWAAVVAVPALWMLIQALPMPVSDLAHPIWASAAVGLDVPLIGAISIDPGMTLVGLGRYLFAVAVLGVATAIAIDRRRAEWMLYLLTGATAVMAGILLAAGVIGENLGGSTVASLGAGSALGVVISAATIFHVAERLEMQRDRTQRARGIYAAVIAVALIAWVLCGFAVVHSSPVPVIFATACGLVLLAFIVATRRLGVAPGTAAVLGAGGLIVAVIVAISSSERQGDLLIRFAATGQMSVFERMIADTGPAGSGAGTFSALLPIYGSVEEIASKASAPTAAAALAIELGRPMWAAIMLAAIAAGTLLFRAAMLRGRDSFHSTAAASVIVVMLLECFADSTLFNMAILTVASSVVGLGLAQSTSRTIQ